MAGQTVIYPATPTHQGLLAFMKTLIIISTLFFFSIASCDNRKTQDRQKDDTPKELEDKSLSSDIISKRSNGDLVEELYSDLVDKTPELKQLENKIDGLSRSEPDSTKSFDNYNSKNQSY